MKKELHIVSHTHWDREWYMSHAKHNYRLVKFFDALMEAMEKDEKFRYFHLDGQAVVIEDYLAVRPEMEAKVRKFIAEGRWEIGPFYILQDEYLINGESSVRNALYGMQVCDKYGKPAMVGYFPDAFGNISQVPQLMQGFGLDNAFFGRGITLTAADNVVYKMPRNFSEIKWRGADGSEIIGVQFVQWYSNCMELPSDKTALKERLDNIHGDLSECSRTPYLLGFNGCDHSPAQENIGEVIEIANEVCDFTVKHTTLEQYIDKVRPYKDDFFEYEGEIAGQNGNGFCTLINTASARTDIKVMSNQAEYMLQTVAEPLSVMAMRNGLSYDSGILTFAQKKLLKSFPHDSICSCSCDEVNDKVKLRLSEAYDTAEYLSVDVQKDLAAKLNTKKQDGVCVVVFNTDVKGGKGVVKATLEFDEKDLPKSPALFDENGNRVIAHFTVPKLVKKFKLPYDSFRVVYDTYEMQVEFIATVAGGLNAATYYVQDCATEALATFTATESVCENEFIRLTFNKDGTFDLTNKADGCVYKNQNRFEITPDCGNEYDFKADGETHILNSDNATVALVEKDEIKAVYEICVSVDGMKLCSSVTVYADKKEILFTTKVANAMKNVRLRATFESNPTAKHVYAEGQFDLVRRNIQPAESWQNPDNSQRMNTFFAVGKDEGAGLVVATKGLYEYEVYRDGKNTMGITLLRAVGEMGDWFYFPTPAGQMQGEYTYSYCLIPFDTDFATVVESGYNYTYPKLLAMQENRHEGEDSLNGVDLTVDGTLLLSAVKKAEKSGEVIVRMYNPLQETAKISAKQAFKQTNLAETEDGKAVTEIDVSSKKIITLKID